MGAFCCDKPTLIDGMVYFAFQKTADGNGESYGSEVFFMRSRDLLRLHGEGRPRDATWETLPRGERGLQTDRGLLLGEEPHVVQISGPRLLCLWRTELGFLDSRYSDDYGETWDDPGTTPQPLVFNPLKGISVADPWKKGKIAVQKTQGAVERNDDLIKDSADYRASSEFRQLVWTNPNVLRNPRGAITPYRMKDGHFALLYYNNGRTDKVGYVGRLVVWLTLGRVEEDGGSRAMIRCSVGSSFQVLEL